MELGVPITVHAGEWPEKFDTINNLKFAINEIKADRLGHAITLRSDEEFLKSIGTKSTIEVGFYFILSKIDVFCFCDGHKI